MAHFAWNFKLDKKGIYMRLYDMHTHTRQSFDSSEFIENSCEAAVKKGLAGIAITNHLDFGPSLLPDWRERLESASKDVKRVSASYAGKLDILFGVELGQPLQDASGLIKKELSKQDFDVILMSLHNISNHDDFYFLDYANIDINKVIAQYFDELYQMVRVCDFDVLTHIDLPLRYIMCFLKLDWDISRFDDITTAILKELAVRGKALEVNMSGPNKYGSKATANISQLKRFKELGGEFVTLASDAHSAEYIGGCFDEAVDMLREAGFEHAAHFKNRKPYLTKI